MLMKRREEPALIKVFGEGAAGWKPRTGKGES